MGEVDGFKIGEGEGRGGKYPPFHRPSPLVFFVAFQDGGHDQCTSELSCLRAFVKKRNQLKKSIEAIRFGPGGGGRGYSTTFYRGKLRPDV